MSSFEGFLNNYPYLAVVRGILLSTALPILRSLLPRPPAAAAALAVDGGVWAELRPFVVIGSFSVLTAVLVLAFAGDAFHQWKWYQALLAGYAWDSTLQKASKQG